MDRDAQISNQQNVGVTSANICFPGTSFFQLLIDSQGTIRDASVATVLRFGGDRKTLIGRNFFSTHFFSAPPTQKEVRRLISSCLADPTRIEKKMLRTCFPEKTASSFDWSFFKFNNPPDAPGEVVVCVGRPISGCGIDENARESVSLLEDFLSPSKIWVWQVSRFNLFEYVSPSVKLVLGYDPEELIGVNPLKLIFEADRRRVMAALAGAVREKRDKAHLAFRNVHKGGNLVWTELDVRFHWNEKGAYLYSRGVTRDVSTEQEKEEKLIRREKEYRYLFENSQVGLMVTSEEGVIMNANTVATSYIGITPEQAVNRCFTDFLPPKVRQDALAAFQKDYETVRRTPGNMVSTPARVQEIPLPDGSTRYVRFSPVMVKVFQGDRMVGVLNTTMDISEAVTAEQKIRAYQERLEEMVAERTLAIEKLQAEMIRQERLVTLGKLTATVSHEIRNPLGTISSSLYVVREKLKDMALGVERPLNRAERAIRRCDGIIEELLDYTRSGDINKRPVDFDRWLGGVLDEMVIPKEVSLVRSFAYGGKAVIDPEKFHRVIVNLIDNAVQSFDPGGAGGVTVETVAEGAVLTIRISDTGCGISGQNLEKIFEPLFSTKNFGVGLGLAVCERIIRLHGGGITVRSVHGKGTRVVVTVPLESGTA